ncbi:S6K1 [Auxenochlorella protothecoides x Auxenochlorella symbiontica]
MSLNPFASDWTPGRGKYSAPTQSRDIRSRSKIDANAGKPADPSPFTNTTASPILMPSPTLGRSQPSLDREGELDFDVGFDSIPEATSGPSTPSGSLVGPSALPSRCTSVEPSPGKAISLLRATEDVLPPEPVVESTAYVSEATTHAETRTSAQASTSGRKLGPADFELLRVVGQGAFGKVFQVRKRDTQEIFAMKVMRKDKIRERDHGSYVQAERDVLTGVIHPYIVTLRYSFQTPLKLYLVLDFINGGHLFFQLYRAGTFDEAQARLYTAEIVLAIAHLHSLGFVHRDLKPENVLLDSTGHLRITDFGLAKGGMGDEEHQRSNSFIGTMEYMAPEVILGHGHGKAVDWWSVGILLHEMLCGVPPFRAKSRPALQKAITTAKFKLPSYLSTPAANLVKALLQKDPTKRLGYGPAGSADIKAHPFFRSINWGLLEQRKVASPFLPSVSHVESVENFDRIWTDLPPQDSPCVTPRDGSLSVDDNLFVGFTYVAPSLLANLKLADLPKNPESRS